MLLYGRSRKTISVEKMASPCTHCKNNDTLEMHFIQKYAHLLWIPLFPMGRTAMTQCSSCHTKIEKKLFDDESLTFYERQKLFYGTPKWTFVGLVLVLLCTGLFAAYIKQNDANNIKYIANPIAGDVYEVKLSNDQFTLYQVEKVKSDTVYLKLGSYETNKQSGLYKIKAKGKDAYSIEIMLVLKSDLKAMFDEGMIKDVDRK